MELTDYKSRLKELKDRYHQDVYQLNLDYATSNNPFKIGDVFTDRIGSIQIDQIKFCFPRLDTVMSRKYFGTELKVDGTPKKSGAKRFAYQVNQKT